MNGEYENILVAKEGPITTIILNRPKQLNALSPNLIDDMNRCVEEIEDDKDTRAVVITGTGRAFSAGGDIELDIIPVSKMNPMQWREYIKDFCRLIKRLNYSNKPYIAAINGVTVGGGCDIFMSCDIRIASDKAKFGHGYIKMGIISDMGGNYLLPRLIGPGKAKLFAFTGDIISAEKAEKIGLIDEVVPDEQFTEEVQRIAQKIANGPSAAIGLTKEAMRRSAHMNLDESLDYSANLQSALLDSEDFGEGLKAFLEKRSPVFRGR